MTNYFKRKTYAKFSEKRRPNRSDYTALDKTVVGGTDDDNEIIFFYHSNNSDPDYVDVTSTEVVQLRDRDRRVDADKSYKTPTFLEKKLESDDSLASLALRYGCTVAELKRANNILSDQEIHGLLKVKLPIKPHSLLTEKAELRETDDAKELVDSCADATNIRNKSVIFPLRIGSSILPSDSTSFFSAMDEDLERIRCSAQHYKSSLEEVTAELTCKRFYPMTESCQPQKCKTHHVIVMIVTTTLVIPVIIFLYVEWQKRSIV